MAGQRHSIMKHRRIVSDTSALHLPIPLMQHQQQHQQGMFMPPTAASHHDDPLSRYVMMLVYNQLVKYLTFAQKLTRSQHSLL